MSASWVLEFGLDSGCLHQGAELGVTVGQLTEALRPVSGHLETGLSVPLFWCLVNVPQME